MDEYQLDAFEAGAEADSIVDATVTEETILLRLNSGKVRLLHLVQADDRIRFDVEDLEANSVGPD